MIIYHVYSCVANNHFYSRQATNIRSNETLYSFWWHRCNPRRLVQITW